MPYVGQFGSKTSHSTFIKNPEVASFLEQCQYLTPPSDDEARKMVACFRPPPSDDGPLPRYIISVDGSVYESSIDDKLPSTKVGYIKIGAVLFSLLDFDSLREGQYVDPFRVAALRDQNTALTFALPSANIRLKGKDNVRDSFRAVLDEQFLGERTRFEPKNFHTSLRSTLFQLASRRPGRMGTKDPFHLRIYKCPHCGKGPVELEDTEVQQFCPFCGAEVYPTDCLRLWEEVSDYQSNRLALSRLMMVLEHLLPVHYMRFIMQRAPLALTNVVFFIDGPLAVFGTAAWLHRSIMIFLDEVNRRLARHKQPPLLVIGLQKSGQVVDHLRLIERYLPNRSLYAIDDDYRYQYILSGRDPSSNGFGSETYYGQDFIYKTRSGRTFVFALPYPFASKDEPGIDFPAEKTDWNRYLQLPQAIRLIEHLESDLYRNAVVPIALAHRYTSISLQPGGRVLDLLTRKGLSS